MTVILCPNFLLHPNYRKSLCYMVEGNKIILWQLFDMMQAVNAPGSNINTIKDTWGYLEL